MYGIGWKSMPHIQRRSLSLALVLSVMMSSLAVLVPTFTKPADAARRAKTTKYEVCHRTSALNNPYRRIRVAWSSVSGGNGHDSTNHDGPVFNVSAPLATHGRGARDSGLNSEAGGGNDHWGDIFYASRLANQGQGTVRETFENNWTEAGQAIFNGATFTLDNVTKQACRTMNATEYITSEVAAKREQRGGCLDTK